MTKRIKTIQIAFNIDDPFQRKLYEHMKKHTNISFYGKSLIQKDIDNNWVSTKISVESEFVLEEDLLKSFI